MKIVVRLAVLLGLAFSLGLSLSDASGFPDASDSTEVIIAEPMILKVEPDVATPWSYVVISGQNLMGADGSCSAQVSGITSSPGERSRG